MRNSTRKGLPLTRKSMRYQRTNQWADDYETPGLTEQAIFKEAVAEVKRLLKNIPAIHIPGLARRYPQWRHIIIDVVAFIESEGLAETELQGEITAVRPCDKRDEIKRARLADPNDLRDKNGDSYSKRAAAGMLRSWGHHKKAANLLEEV